MFAVKSWGLISILSLVSISSAFANEDEMINVLVDNETLVYSSIIEKGKTPKMTDRVRAYDPVNKDSYEKVILGEVQKAGGFFNKDYDYWRYVTVYDVETTEERIAFLPFFEEDCHDNSFFMAQWGESRSIRVTFNSQVGFEGLGLSASVGMSIEQGTTFSTARRVKATENIKAIHYPFKRSSTFTGVTYKQTFNSKTNQYGYLMPSYFESFSDSYPYEFYLDNQNLGFIVKREIVEHCKVNTSSAADRDPEDIIFNN